MPIMKLKGDVGHDWPIVFGHMHYPNEENRAGEMASMAAAGENAITHENNELVAPLLASQAREMRNGQRSDRLKGKPSPAAGMLAGDVLLTSLAIEHCVPGKGNSYIAAHVLERMRKRGEWVPIDKCIIPKNRDTWRHAFHAFRPVAHLWAAKRIIMDICLAEDRDVQVLPETAANRIQSRFGYFLGIAEGLCNIAEQQITRGKMLMPRGIAWRVPLNIELEAPEEIHLPDLNADDLWSYTRQVR